MKIDSKATEKISSQYRKVYPPTKSGDKNKEEQKKKQGYGSKLNVWA